MREEEANFIAFLACRESGDPEMIYSAYLYVLNRLAREIDRANFNIFSSYFYNEAYYKLPAQARFDIENQRDYWWGYFYRVTETVDEDTGEVIEVFVPSPIVEVTESVNDGYLKINGQEDGVKSYGKMLDLVIAVYLNEK
jgi:hypothetical protein